MFVLANNKNTQLRRCENKNVKNIVRGRTINVFRAFECSDSYYVLNKASAGTRGELCFYATQKTGTQK